MKHKVIILLDNLGGGGAERVLANIANGLCLKGYEVQFCLTKAEGPYLNSLQKNINVVESNATNFLKKIKYFLNFLSKEENKNSILITASLYHSASIEAVKKLSGYRNRHIVTLHYNYSIYEKLIPKLNRLWIGFLYRYLILRADKVVGVSKGVSASFNKLKHNISVSTIYNPVFEQEKVSQIKEEKKIPIEFIQTYKNLIALGRFAPQKDYGTMIRAMASVVNDRPDVRLFILGDGPEKKMVEQMIEQLGLQKNVIILGFKPNAYEYLNSADLLILSSLYEGLPTVIIEALAFGVNVVSTDCPSGPSEILENGKLGFLSPVGDEKALAQNILKALQQPFSSNLLEAKASQFTIDKVLPEYIKLLE